eukprot:708826-Prymnesium_polylepis.1
MRSVLLNASSLASEYDSPARRKCHGLPARQAGRPIAAAVAASITAPRRGTSCIMSRARVS